MWTRRRHRSLRGGLVCGAGSGGRGFRRALRAAGRRGLRRERRSV